MTQRRRSAAQLARTGEPDLFRTASAHGGHEVIVNSPRHVARARRPRRRRARRGGRGLADADRRPRRARLPSSTSASTRAPHAGSTLPHSHAQLFALPFVPTEVARERERFTAYHERTMGSHLLEDVIVEEVRRRDRLVAIDGEAALFCPWASRSPFELRLVPRTVPPRFDRDERGAALLGRALRALAAALRRRPAAQPLGPHGAAREPRSSTGTSTSRRACRSGPASSSAPGSTSTRIPPERAAAELREALPG